MSSKYERAYRLASMIRVFAMLAVVIGVVLGFRTGPFTGLLYAGSVILGMLPLFALSMVLDMLARSAEKQDRILQILEVQSKMLQTLGRIVSAEVSTVPRNRG